MNELTLLGLWPSRLAILFPLLGSLAQLGLRGQSNRALRFWVTFGLVDVTATLALLHILSAGQLVCMFAADTTNCFVSALGSIFTGLLLTGLSIVLLFRWRREQSAPELNHTRLLLFVAALAGVALGESLLIVIPALIALYASLDYWLRNRGLRWGFLVVRDDYKDDIG